MEVVELAPAEDRRGAFTRLFDRERFTELGLRTDFDTVATSMSPRAGTLRGLHYQLQPNAEHKLIRCMRGRSYHVALDLRRDSPAFGRWAAVELEPGRPRALYVPGGVAHGVQTTAPDTEILYLIAGAHDPDSARGVRFDDPAFAIDWPPAAERVVAERDRTSPDFS